MNFKLKIWRQANPKSKGEFGTYEARNISPNTSFLEMLDIVNDELTERGEAPIAFDSDCREGICGTCALTINGQAHVPKHTADLAMEAAACIGCGACAAACPNASAMLFTAAKVSHLAFLPQGGPERSFRVLKMVRQMDAEGFGNCTNTYECEAVCPAEISASLIAKLNREYARAQFRQRLGE